MNQIQKPSSLQKNGSPATPPADAGSVLWLRPVNPPVRPSGARPNQSNGLAAPKKSRLTFFDKIKLGLVLFLVLTTIGFILLLVLWPKPAEVLAFTCPKSHSFKIQKENLPENTFLECPECQAIVPRDGQWDAVLKEAEKIKRKGFEFYRQALKEPDREKGNELVDKAIGQFRQAIRIYESARDANPQTYLEEELNELMAATKEARMRKVRSK